MRNNQYAIGNNGGRPRIVEEKDLPDLGLEMLTWFIDLANENILPFFSKFSREVIGCSEDTLSNYCEQNKEFFGVYKKCKEIQKEILINLGLSGKVNPTFAIFTAKNITDMKDRNETDITSHGERIIGFEYVKPNRESNKI